MNNILKSFPFCGSESEFNSDEFGEGVCCKSCGATLHNGVYGEEGRKLASADWNSRPIENELHGKIGKLEAENKRLREALQMISTEKDNHGQWLSVEQAAQIAKDTLEGCLI